MSLTRRDMLAAGAGSAAVIANSASIPGFLMQAAAAAASEQGERVLVVVQLTGGNDGLNTVIPYADDEYHRNRFATRIDGDTVLQLDDYLGFHPSMKGMAHLYERDKLSLIQGVGYPNPNRSHFESMDIWHTAMQTGGTKRTGWLGRYLDASQSPATTDAAPALHLGSRAQPLALAGLKVHVPTIESIDAFRLRETTSRQRETIQRLVDAPRGEADAMLDFLKAAAQSALSASQQVQQAVQRRAASDDYPSTQLARSLRSVAQLIEAGMSTHIYYVTLDGFDTHSEQAGAHAGLLQELSDAIAAFVNDMDARGHGERVTVMTFSEFGRRVRENASRGTDHGAAAPVLVAGGAVAGGVIGKHPSLFDLEDGDLQFHTDFRSIYTTLLEDWLGVSASRILAGQFERLPMFV